MTKVICPNCAFTGNDEDILYQFPNIPDLGSRVAPGEPVPFGECPKCGSLVHEARCEACLVALTEETVKQCDGCLGFFCLECFTDGGSCKTCRSEERAGVAKEAINEAHPRYPEQPVQDSIFDLIGDLMHLAYNKELDINGIIEAAGIQVKSERPSFGCFHEGNHELPGMTVCTRCTRPIPSIPKGASKEDCLCGTCREADEEEAREAREAKEENMTSEELREYYGHWEQHPDFPVRDWAFEAQNDDTRLGYWEWVAAQRHNA